jgi:hypothetical protein
MNIGFKRHENVGTALWLELLKCIKKFPQIKTFSVTASLGNLKIIGFHWLKLVGTLIFAVASLKLRQVKMHAMLWSSRKNEHQIFVQIGKKFRFSTYLLQIYF